MAKSSAVHYIKCTVESVDDVCYWPAAIKSPCFFAMCIWGWVAIWRVLWVVRENDFLQEVQGMAENELTPQNKRDIKKRSLQEMADVMSFFFFNKGCQRLRGAEYLSLGVYLIRICSTGELCDNCPLPNLL
eukprot:scaffold14627_cov46-Cyclotella_meneghiniana.AAC.1